MGAVLLASAIKHSRLDVVEDVYENCVYLPRLAARDNSTINLSQCISGEALQQLEAQIPNLNHLGLGKQNNLK
jgi:hypothetical protein